MSIKRQTSRPPPLPPGVLPFEPRDNHRPLPVYQRNLPHWRQQGATYFVTFHTLDALPQEAISSLKRLRAQWLKAHPPPHDHKLRQEYTKRVMMHTEQWLHQGYGACLFNNAECREIMRSALLHFHGTEAEPDNEKDKRVELGGFVIMPNHIHLIARPLNHVKLEMWLGSVKRFVSSNVPASYRIDGHLWQKESHDRIVRDRPHLNNCLRYIGRNPSLSNRNGTASHMLWLNPDWKALGWSLGARAKRDITLERRE